MNAVIRTPGLMSESELAPLRSFMNFAADASIVMAGAPPVFSVINVP